MRYVVTRSWNGVGERAIRRLSSSRPQVHAPSHSASSEIALKEKYGRVASAYDIGGHFESRTTATISSAISAIALDALVNATLSAREGLFAATSSFVTPCQRGKRPCFPDR